MAPSDRGIGGRGGLDVFVVAAATGATTAAAENRPRRRRNGKRFIACQAGQDAGIAPTIMPATIIAVLLSTPHLPPRPTEHRDDHRHVGATDRQHLAQTPAATNRPDHPPRDPTAPGCAQSGSRWRPRPRRAATG